MLTFRPEQVAQLFADYKRLRETIQVLHNRAAEIAVEIAFESKVTPLNVLSNHYDEKEGHFLVALLVKEQEGAFSVKVPLDFFRMPHAIRTSAIKQVYGDNSYAGEKHG